MKMFNEQHLDKFENLTEQEKKSHMEMALHICDTWQLTKYDKAKLLRADSLTEITCWKLKIVFNVEPLNLYLASNLLDIYDALHTIYFDHDKERKWLTTPQAKLSNLSPISIMLFDNLDGFLYIKEELSETIKNLATLTDES